MWSDYKNIYEVSRDGIIRYKSTKEEVPKAPVENGYKRVKIDGKPMYVHRIVAEVFVENQNKCKRVAHKDRNKSNNSCDNLVWIGGADTNYIKDGSYKHGCCIKRKKKPRIYNIWVRMRQRCYDRNTNDYRDYGKRGIKVCDDWNDFSAFMEWSIKNGYQDGLSIDRIDVDGDYCPENCRWVTLKEQARNKRNNHIVEYNGEKKTLAEWCELFGVDSSLLRYRLKHWGTEKAMRVSEMKLRYPIEEIIK